MAKQLLFNEGGGGGGSFKKIATINISGTGTTAFNFDVSGYTDVFLAMEDYGDTNETFIPFEQGSVNNARTGFMLFLDGSYESFTTSRILYATGGSGSGSQQIVRTAIVTKTDSGVTIKQDSTTERDYYVYAR